MTSDRLDCAARSNLFARSTMISSEDLGRGQKIVVIENRDSFDAARAIILGDLLWDRIHTGIQLAIPSLDTLLIGDHNEGVLLPGLAEAAMDRFTAADHPICPDVFVQTGKHVAKITLAADKI